jgi:hypothetical protein
VLPRRLTSLLASHRQVTHRPRFPLPLAAISAAGDAQG